MQIDYTEKSNDPNKIKCKQSDAHLTTSSNQTAPENIW